MDDVGSKRKIVIETAMDEQNYFDENLVPYLENVLDEKSAQDFRSFLSTHREYLGEVKDIRDLIILLRAARKSGVEFPVKDKLSADKIIAFVTTPDELSEQDKARIRVLLAESESYAHEAHLLSELDDYLANNSPDKVVSPAISPKLTQEFENNYGGAVSAAQSDLESEDNIIELGLGWLASLDPKPIAAAAGLFLVLGLFLNRSPDESSADIAAGIDGQETAEANLAEANIPEGFVEVSGASDEETLFRRSRVLVDNNIAFEVIQDKIYVAESDSEKTKMLFSGDRLVAVADAKSKPTAEGASEEESGDLSEDEKESLQAQEELIAEEPIVIEMSESSNSSSSSDLNASSSSTGDWSAPPVAPRAPASQSYRAPTSTPRPVFAPSSPSVSTPTAPPARSSTSASTPRPVTVDATPEVVADSSPVRERAQTSSSSRGQVSVGEDPVAATLDLTPQTSQVQGGSSPAPRSVSIVESQEAKASGSSTKEAAETEPRATAPEPNQVDLNNEVAQEEVIVEEKSSADVASTTRSTQKLNKDRDRYALTTGERIDYDYETRVTGFYGNDLTKAEQVFKELEDSYGPFYATMESDGHIYVKPLRNLTGSQASLVKEKLVNTFFAPVTLEQ